MSTCVEITANDDGSFKVVECEPETSQMEGQEGEGQGQSLGSLDEAMQAAAQILTSNRMPEAQAQAQPEAQDAFAQGFEGVRGNGLNG